MTALTDLLRYVAIDALQLSATKYPCLLRRHVSEILAVAKVAKEKVAKVGAMTTTATTAAMAAAMDHDQTGGMSDTATGVTTAPPGTMVDVMTDVALAPIWHILVESKGP